MADEKEKPQAPDPLSKDERAYFESRGEKGIPELPLAEPPVAEAPAEKPPAPDIASPPADKAPPQSTVPQAALHEERKRRQEAEERARQLELQQARIEERFRTFRDAMTGRQQAEAPPPPTPDQDIFGAVKHLQAENVRTRQEIDNYKQQIQQEDNLKRLRQWGADVEANFVRQTPDYFQALNMLRQARARELQVWGMPPSQITTQLMHEENQLLARAAAERRNPAEMAYNLAKERGYQKSATPAAPPQPPARHEVDLNRIEAGQRQSNSLSTVGGGAGGRDIGDIEIDDLLKMNDREFSAFIEKYPGKFRRLKGAAH